tara:strand:+ start:177232 stop:177408 length:177 start_codon:yes stop_codon:yes gene_type:complete
MKQSFLGEVSRPAVFWQENIRRRRFRKHLVVTGMAGPDGLAGRRNLAHCVGRKGQTQA